MKPRRVRRGLRQSCGLLLVVLLGGIASQLRHAPAGRVSPGGAAPVPSRPPAAGPVAGTVAGPSAPPVPTRLRLPLPALLDAAGHWRQRSPVAPLAAFQDWTARYLEANPATRPTLVAEGIARARDRRQALHTLIALDPEAALAATVPESVRRDLPAGITALLESRVDGRGDLVVTGITPGDVPLEGPGVLREARIQGRRYAAHVYGPREAQPSRWGIPLHGIALDGRLALSALPGRLLEPAESAAVTPASADPVCRVSQQPSASLGTPAVVRTGEAFEFYCGVSHAAAALRDRQETEILLPPAFRQPPRIGVDAASEGSGIALANFLADADPAWTTGNKRAVVVRVNFKGQNLHDLGVSHCAEILRRLDETWDRWSYGRCRLRPLGGGSHVTPILDLPKRDHEYSDDDIGEIWGAAEDWADEQGHSTDEYDFLIVLAGPAEIQKPTDDDTWGNPVTWGGKGRIGGRYTIMRVGGDTAEERIARNTRVTLHELGHNLGLQHASSRYSQPKPIFQFGFFTSYEMGKEYGDVIDLMGRGRYDYNVRSKNWLHWLDDGDVPVALTEGRYVLQEHDLGERGGAPRGLQVPYLPGLLLEDSLFVEYRLADSGNPRFTSGPTIRLGLAAGPKSYLLDGRPETPNDQSMEDDLGTHDSQLPPGRTLSSTLHGATVHITTLSADPESGRVEVLVRFGTPAGNRAPTGSILPWSKAATGQMVHFTADAVDPDGDELSYAWEATGHGYDIPAEPTVGLRWYDTGTQTVRCRVSDRHGGVATLTYEILVQFNKPPAIQAPASATTAEDAPLTIDFSVSDPTLDPSAIVSSVVSSNQVVVPAGNVAITSLGGGQRRLTITPAPNQHGLVPLFLTASDGQEKVVHRLDLTVRPVTPGPVLVAGNGPWRYWDLPAAPEAGWAQPGFGEAGWATGAARFVHNQGLLLPPDWTRLRDAPGRVSTYFRRAFPVPAGFSGTLTLKLVCDDGAVIHLNGQEAARHNLPAGGVNPATRALRSIEGPEESKAVLLLLDASLLQPGTNNVLAVEVHDAGGITGRGGGDVAFDAELALLQSPALARLGNVVFGEDTVLGPVRLTASDAESPSGPLTFTARSSNPAVIPDGGIAVTRHPFTGWQFTLVPITNTTGTAEITLEASDGSSLTRRSFTATVTPVNDAPVVDPLPPVVTGLGRLPGLVRVRVRDTDHDPAALQVTAKSSLAALVPASGITVLPGETPDERLLRLLPVPGLAAETTITVQASDGTLAGSASFLFRVSPVVSPATIPLPLVESGAAWRYWVDALPLDSRGNPVDWTSPELYDREWPSGPGQLGYGGQGEKTVLPSLPLRMTTYFRRSFLVTDKSQLAGLRLRLRRDDGAVVYLNGVRVFASNMPRGVITATTPASTDISGAAELAWIEADLDAAALVSGRNLLAVEVHQSVLPTLLARGDLAFDLELDGLPAATGAEDVLVPQRGRWAYWDSPEHPGELWSDGSYPATDWPQGLARLGFGLAGLGTTVGAGSNGTRPPAVLLRHVFQVPDPGFYSAVHLLLQRDDGVAVFLNGTRILDDNLPAGATTGDWALGEVMAPAQTAWRHFLLKPESLVRGANLLAVQLHQASAAGVDLNFDAQLSGTLGSAAPPLFVRPVPGGLELSWPASFSHWRLQAAPALGAGGWVNRTLPLSNLDGWIYASQPVEAADPALFFRLVAP